MCGKLSKTANWLSGAVKYIYGAVMLAIVGVCLFCYGADYARRRKEWMYPTWVYMLLGVGAIALLYVCVCLAAPVLRRIRHRKAVMLMISAVLFAGILYLAFHYYFVTGWDVSAVMGTAIAIATGNEEGLGHFYMSLYPNNILISYLFSVAIRIGNLLGISNAYVCPIVMQCFLFALAGYLLWDVGNTLYGGRASALIWIMYVGMVAASPWVTVPYSDSTGLIFPIGTLWLFVKALKGGRLQNLTVALIAFFWYIGYRIKPQTTIVGIAVMLWVLLKWMADGSRKEADRKQYLTRAVSAVIGLASSVLVAGCCVRATGLQVDEERGVNLSYYLMTGLNESSNGVINLEDYYFSLGIEGREERSAAEWEVIGSRLKDYGVTGLLELMKKKTLTNYMDGSFAWWMEGDFLTQLRFEGQPLRGRLEDYYYATGSKFSLFMNQAQIQWMGVLFLAFLAAFRKKQGDAGWVVLCSLVGIALFEWLFEARARYLFIYVPLYILEACGTIATVMEAIRRKKLPGKE